LVILLDIIRFVYYLCQVIKKKYIMETKFLLPNKFKMIGLILLGIATVWLLLFDKIQFPDIKVLSIYDGSKTWFSFINNTINDEIITLLFIIGACFVGFSREKREDEFIAKNRMESLLWASYINYALLVLSVIFVYDIGFLNIMIYNMFTLLIIFIIRFNLVLIRSKKLSKNEK